MRSSWTLRTRFVVAAIICLLPVLAVAGYVLLQSLENSQEQLIDTEVSVSETVRSGLQTALQDNTDALVLLANDPDVQAFVAQESQSLGITPSTTTDQATTAPTSSIEARVDDLLQEVANYRPKVVTFFLTNQLGAPIRWPSALDQTQIMPFLSSTVEGAISSATATVSGRIQPVGSETGYVAIIYPVFQQGQTSGEVIGTVGALLSVDLLRQSFTPFARGETMIMVVAGDEIVMSSVPMEERELMRDAYLQASPNSRQLFSYEDASGTGRLGVFTPLEFYGATPWTVLVSSPSPQNYGPNQELLQTGVAMIAAAVVATLVLTFVLGDRTARPLHRLTEQAAALARGDFSVRVQRPDDLSGGREVRQLALAFKEMANRLAIQVEEVAASSKLREQQAEELRDLNRRTLRLQEDEQRRIAGEIHDAVSPLITGALYQVRAMLLDDHTAARNDEMREGLQHVSDLLTHASEELHGVIFDLRPPDLDDLGVVAAIERYVANFQRGSMGATKFTVIGEEPPNLTPEIRIAIYRIVQEALHNVVRHSGADEAVVAFETNHGHLQVMIRDNGAGFETKKAQRPTSLGLLSMRERASAIGATLHIESTPGLGTAVILDRPMTNITPSTVEVVGLDQPDVSVDGQAPEAALQTAEAATPPDDSSDTPSPTPSLGLAGSSASS